ncbi:OmpL47-type beta-barrel domain-containing protein [Paenibacillus kandeliae]|uniref:OmpL47-type beta-barrel domain-containing protein n=1 Tax=Paenibacillus kandeliae TaxID=3231269 RepID=UPI00345AF817
MIFNIKQYLSTFLARIIIIALLLMLVNPHMSHAAVGNTTLTPSGSKYNSNEWLNTTSPVAGGSTVNASIPIWMAKSSNPYVTAGMTFRAQLYGELKDGSGSAWGALSSQQLGPYQVYGWNRSYQTLEFTLDASRFKTISRVVLSYSKSGDTYVGYELDPAKTATMTVNDTQAPTSPSITLTSNGWNQSQTFTIGNSTDNTEVKGYFYQINNGDIVSYNSPVVLSNSGIYTITAYAEDITGLRSSTSSVTAYVDHTPPDVPTIRGVTDSYTNAAEVQVSIDHGSDAHSGVNRTEYALSGATTNDWTSGTSLSIVNEGITNIVARTIDNVGNISSQATGKVYIDRSAPVVSLVEKKQNAMSAIIQLSATDSLSGISKIQMPDGSIIAANQANYTVTKNGNYTFTVIDNANNAITKSIEITDLDATAPQLILQKSSDSWTSKVTISALAEDTESGVSYIRLPDNSLQTGANATFDATKNGTYTFTAVDRANNEISQTIAINNIDDQSPTFSISQNGADWTNKDIDVTFSFSDQEMGLDSDRLYYTWTNSPKEPDSWESAAINNHLTLATEGIWYLHAKGYDKANNSVVFTSHPYRIQHIPAAPELNVIGKATDKTLVSWNLPAGNIETDGLRYVIENKTTGSTWSVNYPVNELSDTSLIEGSEYEYVITAYNHVGNSTGTHSVKGFTLPGKTVHANVYSIDSDYEHALVRIQAVKSAIGYRITSTNLTTQQVDDDITVTGNTYEQISHLQPYTWYDIAIRAINSSGEGDAYHVSFLSLPDRVSGFTSAVVYEHAIGLTWNSVTQNVYNPTVTEDTYYKLLQNDQTRIYEGKAVQFENTGLQSGTPYSYSIAASNRTGSGSLSYLNDVWTLPEGVSNVRQHSATTEDIVLQWNAPRGVSGYRAVIDDTYTIMIHSPVNRYTFQGFEAGTVHKIEISPFNKSGYGQSISTMGMTLPDQPLQTDAEVTEISENSITLSIRQIRGATRYSIQMNGNEYIVNAGTTIISNLKGGTVYDFSVRAGNMAGWGTAFTGEALTLPVAPTSYHVINSSSNSVHLGWEKVRSADYYQIYSSNNHLIQTVTKPEAIFNGLTPGGFETFKFKAINRSGTGRASDFSWRNLPGFEKESEMDWSALVSINAVDTHHISISWEPVHGADYYNIVNNEGQKIIQTTDCRSVISGLPSASMITGYTVVPVNSAGNGRALLVPDTMTKPDATFSVSYESTRSTVTLHIAHDLTQEQFVIERQGQEIYRGTSEGFQQYTQEHLQSGSEYTFHIWTENKYGEQSAVVQIVTKTKNEHEASSDEQLADQSSILPEPSIEPKKDEDKEHKHNEETRPITATSFIDIDKSFAKEAITRLQTLGIVEGMTEEKFMPQDGTTRIQFLAMLTRLVLPNDQIQDAQNTALTFVDTDSSAWYIPTLKAAVRAGIAQGYDKDFFKPDQLINREQAAKMLSGALSNLLSQQSISTANYTDNDHVSEWAKKDVNTLTGTQILEGYPDQSFKPQASLTRAESALMIDRAIQTGMIKVPSK